MRTNVLRETLSNCALPKDKMARIISNALLLDVHDVAAICGCSARHVKRLADLGEIPAPIRLGHLRRWSKAALETWITLAAAGKGSK